MSPQPSPSSPRTPASPQAAADATEFARTAAPTPAAHSSANDDPGTGTIVQPPSPPAPDQTELQQPDAARPPDDLGGTLVQRLSDRMLSKTSAGECRPPATR